MALEQWSAFLGQLSGLLESYASQSRPPFTSITFDPARSDGGENEVLVGMGTWSKALSGTGAFFTIKGLPDDSKRYVCLCDLILDPPQPLATAWEEFAGDSFKVQQRLGSLRLVVKDISPDSCLALVLWLARCSHVALNDDDIRRQLEPWLAQVRSWEQGYMLRLGDYRTNWCALHSAFGHAFIDDQQMRSLSGDGRTDTGVGRAWLYALRYLVGLLRAGASPTALSSRGGYPLPAEQQLAESALVAEEQAYRHSLQTAVTLQLAVPMEGIGRRRLVDVFLSTELVPSGISKVLLRNDREHSWSRQGFALMGLYLPHLHTIGGHITFSVDPDSGLHLRDLWLELERMEDEAWAGNRPRDTPRPIRSYPRGDGPNQPWWDDHGRYTLVSAPYAVTVDGTRQPGSRLTWPEVVTALWRTYHPLHEIELLTDKGNPDSRINLINIASVGLIPSREIHGKRLLCLYWPDIQLQRQTSILFCPSVVRYFAALVSGEPVDVLKLPETDEFTFLTLSAGYAWVHRSGVLLVDDWRPEALPVEDLEREFERACRLDHEVRQAHIQLGELALLASNLIAGWRKSGARHGRILLLRLSRLQAHLRRVQTECMADAGGHDARALRQAMEGRWTAMSELDRSADETEQIASTIRTYAEINSNRILNAISIYGFPLVFWSAFFQFVLQDMPGPDVLAASGLMVYLEKLWTSVHWPGMGIYALLIVLSIVGLRAWSSHRGHQQDQDRNDPS